VYLQLRDILDAQQIEIFQADPPGSPVQIGRTISDNKDYATTFIDASFTDSLNPMRFQYKNTTIWCSRSYELGAELAAEAVQTAVFQGGEV
jgi:hypothetical protein